MYFVLRFDVLKLRLMVSVVLLRPTIKIQHMHIYKKRSYFLKLPTPAQPDEKSFRELKSILL